MPLSRAILNQGLAEIEAAAVAGERCPVTRREGVKGLSDGVTTALAREGRIRIEVYAKNWRVAEILKGPNAGKRTKAPPNPEWRPYLTIGVETVRAYRAARALGPSAPRPLHAEELGKVHG